MTHPRNIIPAFRAREAAAAAAAAPTAAAVKPKRTRKPKAQKKAVEPVAKVPAP